MLMLVAGWMAFAQHAIGSDAQIEANASRGREVLEARNCLGCHTIGGNGAGTAPDLARRSVTEEHTPSELAALMWSHGPEMWRLMEARSLEVKPLSETEADDLYAYFLSLRYFDPRGEAIRGKELFTTKRCASCHDLNPTEGGGIAPPVSEWSGVGNAIVWAEQLWNHSAAMERMMAERGMGWPTFSEQEMVDLLVYLQNLPSARGETRRLEIAAPETGRAVFAAKRCDTCHTVDAHDATMNSLGGRLKDFNTLSGFTAAMWNHAHELRGTLAGSANEPVTISTSEMRELVSYLYFNGGFEERGDAASGRKVFTDKGCQSCHGPAGAGQTAPTIAGDMSAARMASAVWSHGPQMLEAMRGRGVEWPSLTSRQMANLIAFLDEDKPQRPPQ